MAGITCTRSRVATRTNTLVARATDTMIKYTIRPFVAADLDLLYDSWLNSWRTSPWAGVIPNNLYYPTQRELIDQLIARGAVIHVADEGRTLLGWACCEVKDDVCVLHYTWTKDIYLGRGVEDQLLESLPGRKPGFITHMIPRLAKAKWKHVPAIARRPAL